MQFLLFIPVLTLLYQIIVLITNKNFQILVLNLRIFSTLLFQTLFFVLHMFNYGYIVALT